MARVAVSKAQENFEETLNRVADGERIILHRRGKNLAAVVPIEDLNLLKELEDSLDLEAALEARQEPGTIPWEKVKADLGL